MPNNMNTGDKIKDIVKKFFQNIQVALDSIAREYNVNDAHRAMLLPIEKQSWHKSRYYYSG